MRVGEQQLLRTLRGCHAAIAVSYRGLPPDALIDCVAHMAIVNRQRAIATDAVERFFGVLDNETRRATRESR